MIGDLLKPVAPKICLSPGHCSNCARFLPWQISRPEDLCDDCKRTEDRQAAIWVCLTCETIRKYGDGKPQDTLPKRLGCFGCGQVTEHRFLYVNR